MGYRVPPWSEEMPRQMSYQADPRLAEQYQRMGEEQYAREVNQQEKNTEATRDVLARQQRGMDALNDGAVRGVGNFVEARERGADRQMKQATFEREGKQSEESLATMKQQRNLAAVEDQRRAESHPLEQQERAARVAGTEAETKGKVSAQAFADAVSTQKDADGVETNAMYERRKGLEAQGYSAETARLQVQNETQNLAQKKAMAPLEMAQVKAGIRASDASVAASGAQTQNAQMQIAQAKKAESVKSATNILQAEMSNTMGDPAQKQQRVQAAVAKLKADGADPAVVAEAINGANASESQKAFLAKQMEAMDPVFGAKTATLVKGHQDATVFKQALADMQSAYQEYKASGMLPGDAKGDAAKAKFQAALRAGGEDTLAEDLDSNVGGFADFVPKALGGSGQAAFGRTDKMREAMVTTRKRWSDQLGALRDQDPRFGQYQQQIANAPVGDPSGSQVAAKYVTGGPTQSMANGQMSQQPASVQGFQGLPGVKIRPQVGQK